MGGTTRMLCNSYVGTLTFQIDQDWERLLPAFETLTEKLGGAQVMGEEGEAY